ncbi:MAG: hypothetical protein RI906_825 [Pseudomonadota bacterium]
MANFQSGQLRLANCSAETRALSARLKSSNRMLSPTRMLRNGYRALGWKSTKSVFSITALSIGHPLFSIRGIGATCSDFSHSWLVATLV